MGVGVGVGCGWKSTIYSEGRSAVRPSIAMVVTCEAEVIDSDVFLSSDSILHSTELAALTVTFISVVDPLFIKDWEYSELSYNVFS